ncbi:TetR/AcrR family transcriptional regulator C-terminal domain-containing protein [Nocardia cyriacigeorgica]|uniref:TetR/AcrR family transcriptional regulator C-terminal domain-containing protein n=1 Tax=Nocardia cyriacigeorgica TaxID=135487 RepID=UPI002458E002|nr:TetR/AcrR family transcriptional regulator C-terminal domain-containing protein [Nocardia cyriacigeorgica]
MARTAESDNAGRGTIWERLDQPPTSARVPLSHDRIALAAIELADAEGLGAVSMRRLAEHLGVATMAPYRYISGKDDLFELMVDMAHADIDLPAASEGWKHVLRAYADQVRAVTLRHPWLVQIYARLPGVLTPRMADISEQALSSMTGLDVDVDAKMAILATVTAFTHGAAAAEVAQHQLMGRQGWDSDDDVRSAYHPYMAQLTGAGRYPALADYLVNGSNNDTAAWQFDFGLDCVLDGIGATLRC